MIHALGSAVIASACLLAFYGRLMGQSQTPGVSFQTTAVGAGVDAAHEAEWRSRPPVPCNLPQQVINTRSNWNADLWPNGVVPYAFDGNTSAAQRNEMRLAMNEIEAVCAAKFIPRTSQTNYVHIRNSTGNSSSVGMIGGAQTINIFNWNFRFIMAHELMHALGIWHEQQRPDRGSYVTINYGNIQSGTAHNFDIAGTPVGTYDFESVMHYDDCAFSVCCAAGSSCGCAFECATIQALPAYAAFQGAMGQLDRLSAGDQLGLISRYGAPNSSRILNISGPQHCEGAGTSLIVGVSGGTHILIPTSSGGGGAWDAWSPWPNDSGCFLGCCTTGWRWSYQFRIGAGPWQSVGRPDCPRPDPGSAFSNQSELGFFTSSGASSVEFRHSDNGCSDNRGGVSVRLARCASISSNPAAQSFCTPGGTATFSITALGDELGYRWYRNNQLLSDGGAISGSGTPTLTISPVSVSDVGFYRCEAGNPFFCGFTSSSQATLEVSDNGPIILEQPRDITVNAGRTATFAVTASGLGAVSYRWRKDGINLVDDGHVIGAFTRELHVMDVEAFDMGNYDVVATDICGTRTSGAATLSVSCGEVWETVRGADPAGRSGGVLVFDAARSQAVLFGGDSTVTGANIGDTWTWNGAAWTQRAVAGPSRRRYAAAAYDSLRERVVLFGGLNSSAANLGDTWAWDGSIWSQISGTGPSARQGAMAAYDAARDRVVLFGGYNGSVALGDTWEWDGASWTLRATSGPPARLLGSMAYDAHRGVTVLFGGDSPGTRFGDTWEWNGSTWSNRNPASAPPARDAAAFAYDSIRLRCVLFGGNAMGSDFADTWEWDGTAWTPGPASGPGARRQPMMAFDSARGRCVLFAGYTNSTGFFGDTWEYDGAAWSRQSEGTPLIRYGGSLAADSTRGVSVLFGGFSPALGDNLQDTWEWNGTLWSRRSTTGPAARRYCSAAFDSGRARTVLFGGWDGSSNIGGTWEWDGSTWTNTTNSGPPARHAAVLAYDSIRRRIVLFGGNTSTEANDTWEYDGSSWSQRSPANSPGPRHSGAMAYDEERRVCVHFGGQNGSTLNNQTWTWDGTDWSQRSPANSPSARRNASMVYDAARRRIVLFGGSNLGSTYFNDTWEWDGVDWTMVSNVVVAPARRWAAGQMTYDPDRKVCVLFGGDGQEGVGALGDTWERRSLIDVSIAGQPQPQSVEAFSDAAFFVVAPGGPHTYRWRKDGVNLSDDSRVLGSHAATLILFDVVGDDIGLYDVIVSNGCGSVTSNPALLTVTPHHLCPVDFNASGAVSVQDIFDFLAAYFASCAGPGPLPCYGSADFNGSGAISVQDIFDFLTAYFAGCP